ncbi:MAG: ribosomal subunit interface protein [Actinobacteria bacterium 69-20]|nr:ribosome-associated translation inhibitor RaiA [Actinomycetota bacterium]OJV24628.1 MAG: ribosomal subunit interface protein [Actinobacteria bacterium 69-20]
MDIVVTGRNVEVPEHFKVHASDKLARAERYDPKLSRVEVELAHEANPRQTKTKQRVQLTVTGRGPAVRAEASAETFYAALDLAVEKLEGRLRKARGRRLDRVTSRSPMGEVAAEAEAIAAVDGAAENGEAGAAPDEGGPGRVVRIKSHPADPITVDQALWQMELVGHDFYLFNDAESGLASVVYRRKGFDYGLLRLG